MFGKKKRRIAEQQKQIETLNAELDRLKNENQAFRDKAADVERRESGIGRAISEATLAADRMLDEAQRKAGALLEQTQADCDAVRRDAEIMVDDAYRNARDIVKEAEVTGQKKLDDMNQRIGQYAALLNAYDKLVQEQIAMAQDSAKRFAELSKALHDTVPQILSADGTLAIIQQDAADEEPSTDQEFASEIACSSEDEPGISRPESNEVGSADKKEPEIAEQIEECGEGTPLMKDGFPEFEERPFKVESKEENESQDDHLWTVEEITKEEAERDSRVDAIIDDILRASIEQNRE